VPPKPGGKLGGPWKVLAGGSFAVNGMPFAFCDAGVLSELPWAKAQLGAATPSAAIAIKDFNMIPIPSLSPIPYMLHTNTLWRFLQSI
jgi:hypothetical protein